VFNWPAKAEQEISRKDCFCQNGLADSAPAAMGDAKVAVIKAEQSNKNFRRENTIINIRDML
jgi:hypothetical protein